MCGANWQSHFYNRHKAMQSTGAAICGQDLIKDVANEADGSDQRGAATY